MMGVAFLLERRGVVIDRQTVADQAAAEVFSQSIVEEVTSAALSNDIEGEQLGSENPQPQTRAGDPPAGLIAMKRRCLAQFPREGVVLGFYFGSQPIHGLREAARAELQAETIAQNGAGFAHGKSLALLRSAARARARGPRCTPAAPMASDICKGCSESTL